MKVKLIIALLCLLTIACQDRQNAGQKNIENLASKHPYDLPDSLSSRRISFVLELKKAVAESAWTDFGQKYTEGTLIYFDSNRSEVFFPNAQVIGKLTECKEHSDNYLLCKRTDQVPFHMEVMISFNQEDSAAFFFNNPVEQYSSVEETGQYIPSVQSTEMWASMVLHEMFHHFQYNNKRYLDYAKSVIGVLPFDARNLVALCKEDEQFLSLIQGENEMLMKALSASNQKDCDSLIEDYLNHRKERIIQYGLENPHLEQVENYYILQEGSARYMEYQSMLIFQKYFQEPTAPMLRNDPKFLSFSEFEAIDLVSEAFNYLVYAGPSDYHYTIGFNTMRLLDQLEIEYKNDLFSDPEKALHEYLEDYFQSLSRNK